MNNPRERSTIFDKAMEYYPRLWPIERLMVLHDRKFLKTDQVVAIVMEKDDVDEHQAKYDLGLTQDA